jgi:hypothetical protein
MTDPLTASAILTLAFQFANSDPGKAALNKAAEITTEAIVKKLGKLRQLIWDKLQHQPTAAATLAAAESGDTTTLTTVEPDLQIAMRDDPAFAQAVQQLAQQIQQSIQIEEMSGGEVWNTIGKAEKNVYTDNKAPILPNNSGTINITYGTPPQT